MYVILLITMFSLVEAPAQAIAPTTAYKAEVLRVDSITTDAVILTLRLQDVIVLDTTLAVEVNTILEAARSQYDTLKSIHAFPDYVPTQLLVSSDASWTQAWRDGNLMTGNTAIDSLTLIYQMISVEPQYVRTWFLLNFAQPLKMPLLAQLYEEVPGVNSAEPNWVCCDGDNIEAFKKSEVWHLAFSHGWGDCLAGCINRYYWYVTVDATLNAQLVEERFRDLSVPYLYLWNIPPRYAATVFHSVDELLSAARSSPNWWVRRHAVEVIGRLFTHDFPWVGEDIGNLATFHALCDGVRARRREIIDILCDLLDDPDSDVCISVQIALNRVLGLPENGLAFYLPLHKGNSWTFSNSINYEETIVDTQRIGENLYFQFDQFRYFPNILLRMREDNKLMVRKDASEQVWLDFSAAVGDTWSVAEPCESLYTWTVFLESKNDTVTVPAGTFTNCYRFWFHFLGHDNDWVEWYAPGIGPVKRLLYGYAAIEYKLKSAVIDGVQYPTAVADTFEPCPHARCILYQNYPNPFNFRTAIAYQISAVDDWINQHVTLKIYNIVGQEICTLVSEQKQAGYYIVYWNGKDGKGINVTDGIYFYRLKVGEITKIRKMLFIK